MSDVMERSRCYAGRQSPENKVGRLSRNPMSTDADFFAFVLMPFDKAFDDIYKLGIKETATTLGILAE
jgi:hypothetical protein